MAGKYSYKVVGGIKFTDEDIADALEGLSRDARHKAVATMNVSRVSSDALTHFAKLAFALGGEVVSNYGLSIEVPKDETELRDAALYSLRYDLGYADLRDQRAKESGIEPETED